MSESQALPTTLLAFAGNNVVQYLVLFLFAFYTGILLARPLLPSARLSELESLMAETMDMIQSANEEWMLSKRNFNMEIQLRLSRLNLTKSILRSRILQFELSYRAREYLHIFGALPKEIERCKREVKAVQVAVQTEMEHERQRMHSVEINDMVIILSSGFSLPRVQGIVHRQ